MNKYIMFLIILVISPVIMFKMNGLSLEKEAEVSNQSTEESTLVMEERILTKGKKSVAITFDDGPSRYTLKVKEIMDKYNVKGTFFMLGCDLSTGYTDTLKSLVNSGYEIGIHGYSHKMLTRLSDYKLDKEINYTKELLSNMTGVDVSLVRPPYGEINNRIKRRYDVPYILWSIDTKDWKLKDANKIYEKVINEVSDGDIILMHETYLPSVTALDMIIPKLQEMGYQIVTVSELANLNNAKLENGVVYHSFK